MTGAVTPPGTPATRPAGTAAPAPAPGGVRRPDGPAKLTGAARYAGDVPAADADHAVLVTATVPRARLTGVDTAAAAAAPGVTAVLTAADLPPMAVPAGLVGQPALPMHGVLRGEIRYEGQPVAVVLARTGEQARYAARLVRPGYAEPRRAAAFDEADDVPSGAPMSPTDAETGDVAAGLAAAHTVVGATWTTADRHHHPVEPSATLAHWDGGRLVLHDAVQSMADTRATLAAVFGLAPDQVRVVCPFVGGGFGCKGFVWPHQVLAAAAARVTGRPVRLVLSRAQMFTACGHQPRTRQTVTLGADSGGRLTAVRHVSVNATSLDTGHDEDTTAAATWLYASPAIQVRRRTRRTGRAAPTPMRSPHQGPGLFALESAMDELAWAAGIDPVELRLRNEPARDPMSGLPFSSRKLRECLLRGAERFGWAGRPAVPRAMRDGDGLVGWGMAACTMDTFRMPSAARVRMDAAGRITVEAATEEIGTGQPGMMAVVAAEALGVDPASVEVRFGDTRLPGTAITAGSATTMGLGAAVRIAAERLGEKLAANGGRPPEHGELLGEGSWRPDGEGPLGRSATHSIHTYGALFTQVRVDEQLGTVRVERCTGVYAAGRVINPLAARSQLTGGIVWGLGQALLERSHFDEHFGRFRDKNLTGCAVPVSADVPDLDVSFVEEHDRHASPLGAKGIGELGPVGVAAAVANAVYHATGVRVRRLPIGVPDLLRAAARD